MAAIGYTPADITDLAASHYHGDHVADARLFAGSTWIVQQADRDAIFAPRPSGQKKLGGVGDPAYFAALANSKTLLLNGQDHAVFEDGTVVIKFTPGHTPGHQSLFWKLARTGPVLLSGDLYHYPQEITYKRIPWFDFDRDQTAKSRAMIEDFVKKNNAQLWIQHDHAAGIKRKKAPEYYDQTAWMPCSEVLVDDVVLSEPCADGRVSSEEARNGTGRGKYSRPYRASPPSKDR